MPSDALVQGESDFERRRLIELIDYVEATERDKLKVVLDFRTHAGFQITETALVGLPGVARDCGTLDDPIWLRVERLAKVPPPAPDDPELALWLVYPDDVVSAPALSSEIAASGLIELGLLDLDGAPERVALDDYARRPALEEAFELWKVLEWDDWVERESPRRETIKLYNALYMLRQQLDGVSDVPLELACGIGFATLARSGKRLRYPLLTVAHPRMRDDGRLVVFHKTMNPRQIVAYRPARTDWRSHRDIPTIELASLALGHVGRNKSDDETLEHFAKTFSLARIRAQTRRRFEAAIALARDSAKNEAANCRKSAEEELGEEP